VRAYAYLLYDRARAPEDAARGWSDPEASELGAGFRIAMRDLEIRGAGELLGRGSTATSPRWASTCTRGCWRTRPRDRHDAKRG
jgi:RecG-like helicase